MHDSYNGMSIVVCSIDGKLRWIAQCLSRTIEAAVVAGTTTPIFAIDHNWEKSFS